MLCSNIDSVYAEYDFSEGFKVIYKGKGVNAWYNYDNICVSYGNETVIQMTKRGYFSFPEENKSDFYREYDWER